MTFWNFPESFTLEINSSCLPRAPLILHFPAKSFHTHNPP
jgi:hypothetical protein